MRPRQLRILLVEDNPGDVDLMLETVGSSPTAQVFVAEDGERAIEIVKRTRPGESHPRPHVIVLDWNLPRKSGSEVLAEIKSCPMLKHIPVVVMTSSTSQRDILQIYSLGASCCVVKPIELERLGRVMQTIENFWLTAVQYVEEVEDGN